MVSPAAAIPAKWDRFFTVNEPLPLQKISESWFERFDIRLWMLRADLVHPIVSGNKWFKLKYNLQTAQVAGHDTLLSFGGAYSNHIHALAYAGRKLGFKTIGVIRGEAHEFLNPTLQFATEQGMQLMYLDRVSFRRKYEPELVRKLHDCFGDFYLVPEGGSNALAVLGCRELVSEINEPFDVLACACGTGGTLAGIISGLEGHHQALGLAVLKGGDFLRDEVRGLLREAGGAVHENWTINHDYHLGGYARMPLALEQFIRGFDVRHGIRLDPVYTGKLMFGLYDLIAKGGFKRGTTIVALHSGGLQGGEGFAGPGK
ncbi:MAG: 1-aminocyclopropane-1-carboxylate deaminase/D-cysteine desulfhydrase [Gammaproteobacteria bacterium]|nr:1-aminocyclopropane-1-carboxylate deaminase/D-cysteine desulfhydrase [Gammaproteobacteria bacterium]